jgi:hypothetical protein
MAAKTFKKLCGWAGHENPWLVREQFRLLSDSGMFGHKLKARKARPEYFSLHRVARKVIGKDVGGGIQEIGDCFPAGTMVRMADGTEKPIEQVKIGDFVVTGKNRVRMVTDTIAKEFSGELVYLRGKGCLREVGATPDHRFVQVNKPRNVRGGNAEFLWTAIGEWQDDTNSLLPSCLGYEKETVYDLDDGRSVKLDERLGRLIGLFLAEGSIDNNQQDKPCRVRFAFGRHENDLVDDTVRLFGDIFGSSPRIHNLPSKPSVTLVDVNDSPVARLFASIISGNVYSKRVPSRVKISNNQTKLAVIKGWMDGDGHGRVNEVNGGNVCVGVGVSASMDLLQDMYELSLSCGLKPNFQPRKVVVGGGVKTRHPSGQIALYGESAFAIFPELREKSFSGKRRPWTRRADMTKYGLATKSSIVRREVFTGTVYCLEVEGDHSFVANGYAVHNCVSWGAKHAVEYLQCCDILIRGESEKFRPVFSPYYYGTGRVYVGKGQMGNQDGSLGSWMAAAVKKYGTLWANESGVPPYSGAVAKAYGDPRPENDLDKWLNTAKPFLVKDTVNISTFDQLCDEIASGRAVTIASGVGFRMTPGRDGYHEMSGSWPHQMCIYGYGPDYALICNSWGDVHGKLKDFHENDDLPIGTIRARKKAVERIISEGETFSFTNVEGFPEQDLDKALFDIIGKD